MSDTVEKIIKHPNAKVKTVAIRFVEKNLQNSPALLNVGIIVLFIECLQSSETSVGVPSIQILVDLLSSQNFIDDPAVKQRLTSVLDSADHTIALRIYSVAVGVGRKRVELLDKMQFLLEKCLAEMDKNDILVFMNILEVLKDLCLESYGLVYLENKGIFTKLMKKIETIDGDPMSAILVPGLMKFFGNVAVVYPEKIVNAYPALINTLFNCLLSDDFQILYTALDTLGHIAKFDDGKKALDSLDGDQCANVLSHISSSIPNYTSDLKVRAINCFENIFWVDPIQPINNQINYICQKWFVCIFGSDLSKLLSFCHNPFEDITTASFRCLRSLSRHDFGQRAVAATGMVVTLVKWFISINFPPSGGFIEYLLDRNTKMIHEVKQLKYEIIQVLAESNAFDAGITLLLQKYVREGFNYVQAITEVAFESA